MSPQGSKIDALSAFFAEAGEAHSRAIEAVGERSHLYEVGGSRVLVRFAGSAMERPLSPSLQHLAIDSGQPCLTIDVWDTGSTGVAVPAPPWNHSDYLARAEVNGFSDERFQVAYDVWGGVLRILDQHTGRALVWTRNAADLRTYDRSSPLRMVLNWWMRERGRQFVHAAAVGTPDGGVLLAGKSGSGKSTTAVSCLVSGMLYAADDYCLIQTDPTPRVHSLYCSAKLDEANLRKRVPQLGPLICNKFETPHEKALVHLHSHWPERVSSGFEIRAILLPSVAEQTHATLRPASPADALRALAPTTLMQLSGTGGQEMRAMSDLARAVPSFHLALGTETQDVPSVIQNLIREHASG